MKDEWTWPKSINSSHHFRFLHKISYCIIIPWGVAILETFSKPGLASALTPTTVTFSWRDASSTVFVPVLLLSLTDGSATISPTNKANKFREWNTKYKPIIPSALLYRTPSCWWKVVQEVFNNSLAIILISIWHKMRNIRREIQDFMKI